jgi:hypothetical protein
LKWKMGTANLADLANYFSVAWDRYLAKGCAILENPESSQARKFSGK